MSSTPLVPLPQGIDGSDLVNAVNDRLRRIGVALGGGTGAAGQTGGPGTPGANAAGTLYGTHAIRVARPTAQDGTLYIETDRGVVYQARGTQWVYCTGRMERAWAGLPVDLGLNDTGFEFYDTGSLHIWQWLGSAWSWGPGDRHSGEFGQFDADPGAGWHLCDGSINLTKYFADGSRVTNFVVPDQRGFYLQAAGAYSGVGAIAVAPGLTGSTASGVASIGNDSGGGVLAVVAAGVTRVALSPHTHTDAGHVHAKGTLAVDALGLPPTFAVLPYYRL